MEELLILDKQETGSDTKRTKAGRLTSHTREKSSKTEKKTKLNLRSETRTTTTCSTPKAGRGKGGGRDIHILLTLVAIIGGHRYYSVLDVLIFVHFRLVKGFIKEWWIVVFVSDTNSYEFGH